MTACSVLAAEIIRIYQQLPDADLKYTFPFGHYLASAVMILMGLVTREHEFQRRYSGLVWSAVKDLDKYSRKTWVSGKMMRCISRLAALAEEFARPMIERERANFRPMTRFAPIQNSHAQNRSGRFDSAEHSREATVATTERQAMYAGNSWPGLHGTGADAPPTPDASLFSAQGLPRDSNDKWSTDTAWNVSLTTSLPSWAMTDFDFEQSDFGRRLDIDGRPPIIPGYPTSNNNMINSNSNPDFLAAHVTEHQSQNERPQAPLRTQQRQSAAFGDHNNGYGSYETTLQHQQHASRQQLANDRLSQKSDFPSFGQDDGSYLFDFFPGDQEQAHSFLDSGYLG